MPRRILEGNVVSDKQDKTITVVVERRFMHPLYKKYVKSTDRYAAHDENNQFKTGDRVSIIECRPISKRKRWTVVTGDETSAPKTKKEAKKAAAPEKKEKKKPAAKKAAPKKETAKKETAKKAAPKKAAEKKPAAKKKTTAKKKDA